MDAFAVSICKGLSMRKMNWKKAIIIGVYFGLFQALMPVIGYFLGKGFTDFVKSIDAWIAFLLLACIGGKMIIDSFEYARGLELNDDTDYKTMLMLAIATSIDALAVGVTFAFFKVNIWSAASLIGVITFILSVLGTKIGNQFGNKYKDKAEIAGGSMLIIIGIKILLENYLIR